MASRGELPLKAEAPFRNLPLSAMSGIGYVSSAGTLAWKQIMSDPQDSYVFGDPPSPNGSDDIDSLPESGSTSSSGDVQEFTSDAEQQWKESLQQMELLLTMVLIPACGKYFGRKLAFYSTALPIFSA